MTSERHYTNEQIIFLYKLITDARMLNSSADAVEEIAKQEYRPIYNVSDAVRETADELAFEADMRHHHLAEQRIRNSLRKAREMGLENDPRVTNYARSLGVKI